MRRKEKEIFDMAAICDIIDQASVCRLGMVDGDRPYIVPLCFGRRETVLYFHGARKGLKIDLIKANPNVCFEFDILAETLADDAACKWSMAYKSVVGFGEATLVESRQQKRDALAAIMAQYSDATYEFPADKIEATAVIKVDIEQMTGKVSGF
jgi:nitroimidazol reductase NimA-like FMN-containing flavoprotein (pyridoxamine 5'-phosphate oxidase superfamily)